jgi:retron-type reverse transcriptase
MLKGMAYYRLNQEAAPGVDGQTWAAYGEQLDTNLRKLSDRLQRGAYQAPPVERVYRLSDSSGEILYGRVAPCPH